MYVAQAVGTLIALMVVALYAFSAIPVIVRVVTASVLIGAGCGPAAELGQDVAYVIACLALLITACGDSSQAVIEKMPAKSVAGLL